MPKQDEPIIGAGNVGPRANGWMWMTYRDAAGRRIQKNTGTKDRSEAQRTLARIMLPLFEAKVERLRAIANGETDVTRGKPGSAAGKQQAGRGARSGTSHRAVRAHSALGKKRHGAKKGESI
jgi:hypothetical protein